jgi:predicted nuclease of predicted toxin-antitoxin system
MRFLADESCDFSVVRALRAANHDVVAIAEVSPRAEDDDVRERAVIDARILITEDKDFGQLVYAHMRLPQWRIRGMPRRGKQEDDKQ